MRKPNVFMIGAPKCGTTALASYLAEHPQVYFSEQKEPNYFCEDFPGIRLAKTEDEYLSYFAGATEQHYVLAEGSIRYMYSQVAIPKLKTFAPDARLIVMLRNPVDLAYSLHSQALYALYENVDEFEAAWDLQEERARGESIPGTCPESAMLQYRSVSMLGKQFESLSAHFPKDQVFVGLIDELAHDPAGLYQRLLSFLNIEHDGRTEFPKVNEKKRLKSRYLAKWTQQYPKGLRTAGKRVLSVLGINKQGILDPIRAWNTGKNERPPMSESMRTRLNDEFRDDVALLSSLIDPDLSHWIHDRDGVDVSV